MCYEYVKPESKSILSQIQGLTQLTPRLVHVVFAFDATVFKEGLAIELSDCQTEKQQLHRRTFVQERCSQSLA